MILKSQSVAAAGFNALRLDPATHLNFFCVNNSFIDKVRFQRAYPSKIHLYLLHMLQKFIALSKGE